MSESVSKFSSLASLLATVVWLKSARRRQLEVWFRESPKPNV